MTKYIYLRCSSDGIPEGLNAELGRLCPFSAPRGHTFSTCPPRFLPKGISWANFHP